METRVAQPRLLDILSWKKRCISPGPERGTCRHRRDHLPQGADVLPAARARHPPGPRLESGTGPSRSAACCAPLYVVPRTARVVVVRVSGRSSGEAALPSSILTRERYFRETGRIRGTPAVEVRNHELGIRWCLLPTPRPTRRVVARGPAKQGPSRAQYRVNRPVRHLLIDLQGGWGRPRPPRQYSRGRRSASCRGRVLGLHTRSAPPGSRLHRFVAGTPSRGRQPEAGLAILYYNPSRRGAGELPDRLDSAGLRDRTAEGRIRCAAAASTNPHSLADELRAYLGEGRARHLAAPSTKQGRRTS